MSKQRALSLPDKLKQNNVQERIKSLFINKEKNGPWVIELDPTTACNLACHDCISANLLNQGGIEPLRLLKLADEFKEAGVKAVVLIGGGEPMAHKEFGNIGIVKCANCNLIYTNPRPKNVEKNYHGDIDSYMSAHQNDTDAEELKDYLTNVIEWVEATFPNKRKKLMKGQDWGNLYNTYKDETYNADDLEKKIKELMLDDDVSNKKGIYPYLLTGKEKHLSIRTFTEAMKQKVYVKQDGKCKISGKKMDISEMEADHITPWHEGGKTNEDNCQMISKEENRKRYGPKEKKRKTVLCSYILVLYILFILSKE